MYNMVKYAYIRLSCDIYSGLDAIRLARFGFGFGYRVKVSSLTRNNEVFVQGAMEHHVLEVRAGLHHGARRHGLRNPKFFP
ncbi:hypothetical protein YC2023_044436 [Brassica napus]